LATGNHLGGETFKGGILDIGREFIRKVFFPRKIFQLREEGKALGTKLGGLNLGFTQIPKG